MKYQIIILLAVVGALVLIPGTRTASKSPEWQVGQHPRLIVTADEKAAVVAKLTAPNTVSNAVWSAFLNKNRSAQYTYNYADGAFMYWVNGNETTGRTAIDAALNFMASYPDGIDPSIGTFNDEWFWFRDLLLTYDLAHPLLTADEITQFKNYFVTQGLITYAANPDRYPGNKHIMYAFCLYAMGELLEGENFTIPVPNEALVRGATPNGADSPHYIYNLTNIKITDTPDKPTPDYVQGVDYTYGWTSGLPGYGIIWAPTGAGTKEPAPGATYYVSYTVVPDTAAWKSVGKQALDNNLQFFWHDGYYNGGLSPYANLTAEWFTYFFEMIKRDAGTDYAQNTNLKKMVDMYLYERLPSSFDANARRRFNGINDINGWEVFHYEPTPGYYQRSDAWMYPAQFATPRYRGWLTPFVAWATTHYAGDAEGYDQRYAWLWTQAYRNSDGTIKLTPDADWREALWVNDDLLGRYPVTSVPTPTWPKERFFRGREIIYTRTDDWSTPNTQAALFAMTAGNHNYINEHDQADSGSFTFYSLGEDWAIDPGYQSDRTFVGGRLIDHNSVGIDNAGITLSSAYLRPEMNPTYGGTSTFNGVALTDDASAMWTDLSKTWTGTDVRAVETDARYVGVIGGEHQSYVVVADNIKKDANTHSYEWYLHTSAYNAIALPANDQPTVITGNRDATQQTKLNVYSLGPETVTVTAPGSTDTRATDGIYDAIVKYQVTGTTQARFLHVLIPTNPTNPAPTVARSVVAGGVQVVLTWADGSTDTILWRYTGSTITSTGAYGIVSDARLTVVRRVDQQVAGMMVVAGRNVTGNGELLLSADDGTAPITVSAFGARAAISAPDTARLRLGLPFVTNVVLEDTTAMPIYNDGTTVYINGALPLSQVLRHNGLLFHQDFNTKYAQELVLTHLTHFPVDQFSAASGALELRVSDFEWPSLTARDSYGFKRADVFPNIIQSTINGDADYSFRYKFNTMTGSTRILSAYYRTVNRVTASQGTGDWGVNQDYIRLNLTARNGGNPVNTIDIAERVNGAWSWNEDNNTATTLATANTTIADTNWHTVAVHLEGDQYVVRLDGQVVLTGSTPSAHASGYMQWKVIGDGTVMLDDVTVTAIDRTAPAAATGGMIMAGRRTTSVLFGHGRSTDADTIGVHESSAPISANADPASLTLIGSAQGSATSVDLTRLDANAYHAVMVSDASGNRSQFTALAIDKTPPAAVTDLRAQ